MGRRTSARTRLRVYAPEDVLSLTRRISEAERTTLSQAAMALQMAGLLHLIIARGNLRFLAMWRKEVGNPSLPCYVGYPERWLELVRKWSQDEDLSFGHWADALSETGPLRFPREEGNAFRRYDMERGWMEGVRRASKELRLPDGQVAGFLQTAGVIAYMSRLEGARWLFDAAARAPNMRDPDLTLLVRPHRWAEYLGELALFAVYFDDERVRRAARLLITDQERMAASVFNSLKFSRARMRPASSL